jgi:hypothetical protein
VSKPSLWGWPPERRRFTGYSGGANETAAVVEIRQDRDRSRSWLFFGIHGGSPYDSSVMFLISMYRILKIRQVEFLTCVTIEMQPIITHRHTRTFIYNGVHRSPLDTLGEMAVARNMTSKDVEKEVLRTMRAQCKKLARALARWDKAVADHKVSRPDLKLNVATAKKSLDGYVDQFVDEVRQKVRSAIKGTYKWREIESKSKSDRKSV